MKNNKKIPIADAKNVGEKHGYSQVIIVAWDKETGIESVTTWGKTLSDCDQAAVGGNFVKKALGWPNELTQAKPARVRAKERKEGK